MTVTAQSDTVFSSAPHRRGDAVNRETLASMPTVRGQISDFTRLTPQSSGTNSFGGADNRMNNMTVNGAAFNNSFGLGGQPGDRTDVAPISMEAIEQVQVSIAPYDVRQGNFVGASVDTITRSGTNSVRGSVYHRFRNEDFVGEEARGLVFNPGTFNTKNTGGWAGAPIVKNRLFVFGNFENEKDARPLSSFRANNGGEPVAGNVTRVLASDLANLSSFLKTNFNYDTGSFDAPTDNTPQKRGMIRSDLNINANHKFSFNYLQLNSSSDNILSGSTSAGFGRRQVNSDFMNYQGSNYAILENRKTTTGELNSVLGNTMSNSLRVTYSYSDEGRPQSDVLFPFVDVRLGSSVYTSFGSEPFTPNNELVYNSYEVKNDFTKFMTTHEITGGFRVERYHSDNVFYNCCKQGAWTYNSLEDFYTDARDALANPNRTISPVTALRYQVRYMNIPGLDKPSQPLTALYGGAYAQDVWRPRTNLSLTVGLRFDVPSFENTAYNNANANALTFRDENGPAVQYDSGKMPGANILWSPRFGFNYDLSAIRRPSCAAARACSPASRSTSGFRTSLATPAYCRAASDSTTPHAFPFSTNVDEVQADQRHRRAGRELRAERHRQRLPLPAGVAQQHRRRPPPAGRRHRHRGVHVQPRCQRHLLHQRQPAGGAVAHTLAPIRARAMSARPVPLPRRALRHPPQQRGRQPGHREHRPEEPGHRPQLEPRVLRGQADVARPVAAHRLQLRRSEEHHRSGFNGQRVVEQ